MINKLFTVFLPVVKLVVFDMNSHYELRQEILNQSRSKSFEQPQIKLLNVKYKMTKIIQI